MANSKRICSIPNCSNTIAARELCDKHYRRWRTHGDPLHKTQASPGEPLLFLQTNMFYDETVDCLLWPFSKMRYGYGHLQIAGKFHPAHRVMCELTHGSAPTETHQAAHSCNVPGCVNPNHLRWATPKENIADQMDHGTAVFGENHPSSFLNEADVRSIRQMHKDGVVQRRIAQAFSITPQRVNEIVKRKTWKHLSDAA